MSTETPTYYMHKGKLYEPVKGGIVDGFRELAGFQVVEVKELPFGWAGPKIPYKIWAKVLAFMWDSYDKFESETIAQFFFNINTKEWDAWAFPQITNGMTVKHYESHPSFAEQRKRFGDGWISAGSIHHHCGAAAFASGTDESDEKNKDGIHFTVGNLTNAGVCSLHCRMTFDGVSRVVPSAFEVIETPALCVETGKEDELEIIPLKFNHISEIAKFRTRVPYPKEWMGNVFESKNVPTTASWPLTNGSNLNGGNIPHVGSPANSSSCGGNRVLGGPRAIIRSDPEFEPTVRRILAKLSLTPWQAFQLLADENPTETERVVLLRGELVKAGLSTLMVESWAEELIASLGVKMSDKTPDSDYGGQLSFEH